MGILEKLEGVKAVGIDTSLFIYHLEAHPTYCPLTKELFSRIEAGELMAYTSTISLMEIIVRPYRLGRTDIARKYEALLANFPHLNIVDIDRNIARRAAQLRAEYRLRPPDALQVAAGLINRVDAFLSNDRDLSKVQPVCRIILLDDCLE